MREETRTIELIKQLADIQTSLENVLNISISNIEKINEIYSITLESKKTLELLFESMDVEPDYGRAVESNSVSGHDLLGHQRKILVIGGQELRAKVMIGVAKSMGFEKSDLEFVEYDKAKKYIDRIRRDGKYIAIVFGTCPHKTEAVAGYSSVSEKFRSIEGMPYTVDARSKSGHLKVTKASFESALTDIYENLKLQYAS